MALDDDMAGGPSNYYNPSFGLLAIQNPEMFVQHLASKGIQPPEDFPDGFTHRDAHMMMASKDQARAPSSDGAMPAPPAASNSPWPGDDRFNAAYQNGPLGRHLLGYTDPATGMNVPTGEEGTMDTSPPKPTIAPGIFDAAGVAGAAGTPSGPMAPSTPNPSYPGAAGTAGAPGSPSGPGVRPPNEALNIFGAPLTKGPAEALHDALGSWLSGPRGPEHPNSVTMTPGSRDATMKPGTPPPAEEPTREPTPSPRSRPPGATPVIDEGKPWGGKPYRDAEPLPASDAPSTAGGAPPPAAGEREHPGDLNQKEPSAKTEVASEKKGDKQSSGDAFGKALAGVAAMKPPPPVFPHPGNIPHPSNQLSRSTLPTELLKELSAIGHPGQTLRLGAALKGR